MGLGGRVSVGWKWGLVTHMDAIVAAPFASGRSFALRRCLCGTGIGLHLSLQPSLLFSFGKNVKN